jgi:DNA-binding MurR/RpiR family transcriptional regulator
LTEFSREIMDEAELYPEIFNRQLETTRALTSKGRILVSGAGDSYAAALTGTALAGYNGVAVDPRELSYYPMGDDVTVIAVSLGGRTRSLIQSATIHKEHGSKIIVITGNTESPVAELGDIVVRVVHPSYVRGSGFGSFVSMTAAVAGLLGFDEKSVVNTLCYPRRIPEGVPFFIGETWSYG